MDVRARYPALQGLINAAGLWLDEPGARTEQVGSMCD